MNVDDNTLSKILEDCISNGREHNLEVVLSKSYSDHADVVRWCKNCGAVVVDVDFDSRTNPGQIMKMRLPRITEVIVREGRQLMPKPKLYFGHPVNTYDARLEEQLLGVIASHLPTWEIENPNQPHHQEGYMDYKSRTGNGMTYFTEVVLPACQGGIFLPFRDGAWGAGVFMEAKFFIDKNMPTFIINHNGYIEVLPAQYTPQVLSVEQTRARIRDPEGDLVPF